MAGCRCRPGRQRGPGWALGSQLQGRILARHSHAAPAWHRWPRGTTRPTSHPFSILSLLQPASPAWFPAALRTPRRQVPSKYTVRAATGSVLGSGTWDRVSVSLDGTPDESSRLRLDGFGKDFRQDAMSAALAETPLHSNPPGLRGDAPPPRTWARCCWCACTRRPQHCQGPSRPRPGTPGSAAGSSSCCAPPLPLLPVAGGRGQPGAEGGTGEWGTG